MYDAEIAAMIRAEVRAQIGTGALTGFGDGGMLGGGVNRGVNGGCRDVPLRLADEPAPASAKLYDITSLTTSVTVTRCYYMRGPLWIEAADPASYEPTGTGEITLCLKVNTQDGTVSLAQTPDTGPTLPESSEFVNVPIYKLTRTGGSDPWAMTLDCRPGLIQLPVYS